MKKITLLTGLLAITAIAFSQDPVCPEFFKRNNGNPGGCDAQITFFFATCPVPPIQVDSLLTGGVNGTKIPGLTFTTETCANGKVVVCIMGSNIPPSGSLTVAFSDGTVANSVICVVTDGGGGPVPVKLSSFFVNRKNAAVAITWKTETEINSKEYIIQRKTGNDWVDIATVASVKNANGSSYSYSDNNSSKGTSQYRLKMVDFDAAFTNSEIRAVKGNGAVSDFTVFPNPSAGNAKVTISDISEPIDVQLIDHSGRVLKNVPMNNNSSVELNNLQKGMYMIRLVNKTSGDVVIKKLTVVN